MLLITVPSLQHVYHSLSVCLSVFEMGSHCLCFPGCLELTMWSRLALNSTRDSLASFSWVLWYRRKLLDRFSLQSLFSKYSWDGLRETLKWPSVGREVWNNQNCTQSRTQAAVCSVEWNQVAKTEQTVYHGSWVEQSRVEGKFISEERKRRVAQWSRAHAGDEGCHCFQLCCMLEGSHLPHSL